MSEQINLKQSFDVDYMNLLYEDDSVSIVSVLLLHEGVNRNKSNLIHEVVVNALPSLANKPIWAIPNATIFKSDATDFTEHARNENDENNIMIFGTFPESGVNSAEFVDIDGKIYLKVQAVLWKQYAPIAMSILDNRDGKSKISIEILVKGEQDDDGILNVSEMQFLSATVLGAKIPEGIEGSSLKIVRYSLDETILESNALYSTYSQKQKYKIDQKIKDIVEEGLKLKNQLGNNGESASIVMASSILNNDYMSNDEFKILKNYFDKHEKSNIDKITWMLYGGDKSYEWVKEVNSLNKNNKLDFISKDEIGTKEKIIIDKSKDSLSDGKWSDKGLASDCFEASNWKTVCKAVFLKREDGWEDGKEGSLGYPVMEKTGNKVVYNRKGLASAKGYAEKNNETAVLSSLKAIYKHLDLPWEDNNSESSNTRKTNSKKEDDIVEETKNAEEKIDNVKTESEVEDTKENKKENTSEKVEDECKNASDETIPDNTPDNVDTGDCVEVELDDYKAKFEALEKECDTLKNKVAEYEAKEKKVEDEKKMSELLNSYAHCYSEDELAKAKESMKDSTVEDFEKSVNEHIKTFALNLKETMAKKDDTKSEEKDTKVDNEDKSIEDKKDEKKDEVVKNSFGWSVSSFGVIPSYNFSKENSTEDVDCATKYGVKI